MSVPLLQETGFARLSPIEQVIALPLPDRIRSSTPKDDGAPARNVLEIVVAPAATSNRCYVLFSGGRDSSSLLALATHVARRANADDPIPVTVHHRNAPRADESEWQHLVLAHLRLRDRIVLEFEGEQSMLGDAATASLQRNGLVWLPTIQLHGAIYRQLEPGAMVSGEGGDLIIGSRRITAVSSAIAAHRWRDAARAMPRTALPGRLGRAMREAMGAARSSAPWLTAAGVELLAETIQQLSREPLSWRRGVAAAVGSRAVRIGSQNFLAMARTFGLSPVNPFEDVAFATALGREGGFLGLGDRTALMRYLFHDLLPDAVLSRTTKAAFNETRWTERERDFVQNWNGSGVDRNFIDAERLRAEWLENGPLGLSDLHLHAAWLAQHGLPAVPL
ncbi:MAG: hypothetical protein EPN48_09000 [Microbacteriaceae bacterium]|nr:MAG: hypothetical protein EPN48_09000 [Microbacteriaceae bacterium]